METVSRQGILDRLKHSIQLLGCPAEMQLKLLPVFVCKADELALDFDNWKTVALKNFGPQLTEYQLHCLSALDERLTELSRSNPEIWTENAMRESVEWQRIREVALVALEAFGWHLETPPTHADEYVGGS
jgi:hypothetical protein